MAVREAGRRQDTHRCRAIPGLLNAFFLICLIFPLLFPAAAACATPSPGTVRVLPEATQIPVIAAEDIRFRRMSLSQGLSQTRVAQIIQDDEGFLWFGTQHGVNRFDGNGFRVFKHNLRRPDSLSGVFVYALFKDRSGRVWVGTDQGLDVFDKVTETFRHYRLDDRNPFVIHISEDSNGVLWLATGQGLYKLDPQTGNCTRFASDPADPQSLASDDIKSTGEDRAGTFWVATGAGLEAFDRKTGRVTLRIPLRVEVREFSFHEDRFGVFWIIYGSGNGLATFDRKKNELTRLSFYDGKDKDSGLTGVFSILEAKDGTIFLGTMGAGLLKFDRANNRFLSYRNDQNNPDSIAENRVIALFEDLEGNVWTGLHATPPNSFPAVAPLFKSIRLTAAHPNAAGEALVNTIFADSTGAVWVGSGGALTKLDRQTGHAEVVEPLGAGVPLEVLSISEDSAGALWVGTLGTGLHRIDRTTKDVTSFRHEPTDPYSIGSDIVTRIFFDRTGAMWVTTWNGLSRFDASNGRFTTFKRDPDASAEPYFSIVEDRDGQLVPEGFFPAQAHDCKAAVRWLRGNADRYGLDRNRIAAWGASAGGHLAALLGTGGGLAALEDLVAGPSRRVEPCAGGGGLVRADGLQARRCPTAAHRRAPARLPDRDLPGQGRAREPGEPRGRRGPAVPDPARHRRPGRADRPQRKPPRRAPRRCRSIDPHAARRRRARDGRVPDRGEPGPDRRLPRRGAAGSLARRVEKLTTLPAISD